MASSEASSSKQTAKQASSRKAREAEVERRFMSLITPEIQETLRVSLNAYRSFAKILKDSYWSREVRERVQTMEAIVYKNLTLQEEMYPKGQDVTQKKKQVLRNQEEIKQLEEQVLAHHEEMEEMQQQILDRISVLHSRVQAILTHTYELHEYPVSRLFVVLPQDPSGWDALNPFSNKFRLYFLCECGEHTKSIKSTGPHEIHFAKHGGYGIARPSEFFQKYGLYILTILKMLKVGISVAGVTVPALSNLVPSNTIGLGTASLQRLIEPGMDQIIGWMDKIFANQGGVVDEFAEHMEEEGADLCKLGAFLKGTGDQKVLGNLYRTVTDEGHVKWVCIDHYRINYQERPVKELRCVLDSVGGSFSNNDGKVVVRLRSSISADQFYPLLGRSKSVYELDIELLWDCTTSDLEAFVGALRNSRVSILRLDIQKFRTSAASRLLPTLTQYDVIFRIRDLPQVKVFHIVLSYENIKFLGTSPKKSTHASKMSCELSYKSDKRRKKDLVIIDKTLKANSTLVTLDLTTNHMADAIGDDGVKVLAVILETNSTLINLRLYNNNIGVDGVTALAEALETNSTLTTLDLTNNNIRAGGAKALAESLKTNSALAALDLSNNNIRDDGVNALAETLKTNSALTNLKLYNNNIGVDGAKALAEALKTNSTLTTLDMTINNIRVDGAKALAEALKINSTLTTLNLAINYIWEDGAKALAETLKTNSTLTTLYLGHNNIGVDAVWTLADALVTNSTLTKLNLKGNKIEVSGTIALAGLLKINSTLTTLCLGDNDIGNTGVKFLAEALETNSTLATLYLERNHIGDKGARVLAEVLETYPCFDLVMNDIQSQANK